MYFQRTLDKIHYSRPEKGLFWSISNREVTTRRTRKSRKRKLCQKDRSWSLLAAKHKAKQLTSEIGRRGSIETQHVLIHHSLGSHLRRLCLPGRRGQVHHAMRLLFKDWESIGIGGGSIGRRRILGVGAKHAGTCRRALLGWVDRVAESDVTHAATFVFSTWGDELICGRIRSRRKEPTATRHCKLVQARHAYGRTHLSATAACKWPDDKKKERKTTYQALAVSMYTNRWQMVIRKQQLIKLKAMKNICFRKLVHIFPSWLRHVSEPKKIKFRCYF